MTTIIVLWIFYKLIKRAATWRRGRGPGLYTKYRNDRRRRKIEKEKLLAAQIKARTTAQKAAAVEYQKQLKIAQEKTIAAADLPYIINQLELMYRTQDAANDKLTELEITAENQPTPKNIEKRDKQLITLANINNRVHALEKQKMKVERILNT